MRAVHAANQRSHVGGGAGPGNKNGSARESERTPDLGGFGSFAKLGAAVAVAVEMWEPAFCEGFQAPRARQERCRQIPIILPSERHFQQRTLDFQAFSEIMSVWQRFRANGARRRKPRQMRISPVLVQSPFSAARGPADFRCFRDGRERSRDCAMLNQVNGLAGWPAPVKLVFRYCGGNGFCWLGVN